MSKQFSVVAASLLSLYLASCPSTAAANLISNPSFESPALSIGGFAAYTAANNPILGAWVIGVGEVELTHSYNAQAASAGVVRH